MNDLLAHMPMCACLGLKEAKKRALDFLKLQLSVVMCCHVGPGDQTQVLCKNNKCSSPLSHVSSPAYIVLNTYS